MVDDIISSDKMRDFQKRYQQSYGEQFANIDGLIGPKTEFAIRMYPLTLAQIKELLYAAEQKLIAIGLAAERAGVDIDALVREYEITEHWETVADELEEN